MREKGFTLVETLLVLVIVFTLIVASTAFFMKIKERVTFNTYIQQFKLMTYEAYAIAIDQKQIVHVGSIDNVPTIFHDLKEPIRELYWPPNMRLEFESSIAFEFHGNSGIRNQRTLTFIDENLDKRVSYSVQFTYGRLREK